MAEEPEDELMCCSRCDEVDDEDWYMEDRSGLPVCRDCWETAMDRVYDDMKERQYEQTGQAT